MQGQINEQRTLYDRVVGIDIQGDVISICILDSSTLNLSIRNVQEICRFSDSSSKSMHLKRLQLDCCGTRENYSQETKFFAEICA